MARDEILSFRRRGSRRRWPGSRLAGSVRSFAVPWFERGSVPSRLAFVLATKRLATRISTLEKNGYRYTIFMTTMLLIISTQVIVKLDNSLEKRLNVSLVAINRLCIYRFIICNRYRLTQIQDLNEQCYVERSLLLKQMVPRGFGRLALKLTYEMYIAAMLILAHGTHYIRHHPFPLPFPAFCYIAIY